jgi:uncharacterized protein
MRTSQMKITPKYVFVTLVLTLSFVAPVAAGQLEDARAAYDSEDFKSALRLYFPLAEKGNAEAEDMVGNLYAQHLHVPHDYATAVTWYQKAAKQGYAPAESNLGSMYRMGLGVPKNYGTAWGWFRNAANQGDRDAQFSLAEMYENGQGVPEDFVRAYMWYDLATTRDNFDRAAIRRDGVAHKMTTAQMAEAQELLREWKVTRQSPR